MTALKLPFISLLFPPVNVTVKGNDDKFVPDVPTVTVGFGPAAFRCPSKTILACDGPLTLQSFVVPGPPLMKPKPVATPSLPG